MAAILVDVIVKSREITLMVVAHDSRIQTNTIIETVILQSKDPIYPEGKSSHKVFLTESKEREIIISEAIRKNGFIPEIFSE